MEENVKWFAVDKVQTSKNNALRDSVYCDVVYEKDGFVFSDIHDYRVLIMYAYDYNFTWNDLMYQSDYNYASNNVYIVASKFVNDGFGDYLIRYFI